MQMNENTPQYYLNIWQEMLQEFLGWSESQVLEWAHETGKMVYLADPDDIFYHQTPQYWIKYLIIPESLKRRLSNDEIIALEVRILSAFKDEKNFHFPLGTDWKPYRIKIEQILGEYGEFLPASPKE